MKPPGPSIPGMERVQSHCQGPPDIARMACVVPFSATMARPPPSLALRRRSEAAQQLELLRTVMEMRDEALLHRPAALGVRPEVALAVVLVLLIFVARGDGTPEDREREAILY